MSQVYFGISNLEVLKSSPAQIQSLIDGVIQQLEKSMSSEPEHINILETMREKGYRPITPSEYIAKIQTQGHTSKIPVWILKENSSACSLLPTDNSTFGDDRDYDQLDSYFVGDSGNLRLRGVQDLAPTSFSIATISTESAASNESLVSNEEL